MVINRMPPKINRHGWFQSLLTNRDIGLLCIVAQYAEKIRQVNSSRGAQSPQQLPQRTTNTQHPVGVLGVPSQTIHIQEPLYEYILLTKDDDQSTSSRACELMRQGKEMEESNE